MIDDTDESGTPARVATPVSADKSADQKPTGKAADNASQTTPTPAPAASPQTAEKGEPARATSDQAQQQPAPATLGVAELSPEIRTRLRKLEKLEKTYPGTFYGQNRDQVTSK